MTNNALHGFQQQLVDCVSKGQNHIIVAPTGSGKTRVAVEVAGLLFQRKPSARILFLTPTVALAEQQTGEHLAVCTEQACRDGLAVQMRAICCSACHCAKKHATWPSGYALWPYILSDVVCSIGTAF